MLYMFHKDLMRFLQRLSQVCQNQASERKALLAECDLVYTQGVYSWDFLVGVCCPVLQILTRYQTKKCNFPPPPLFQTRPLKSIPRFSDLAFRQKLCYHYLD